MAFIPTKKAVIGTKVILTREFSAMCGKFEVGTEVVISGEDAIRGYSFRDEQGNELIECGWSGFKVKE